MRDFWHTALRSVRLLFINKIEETLRSFSTSGRALFTFFAGVCVVSSIGLLYLLNASLLIAVPARGGGLTEGIIGSPRFINPVLAISDPDRDLTALVYSGLLRATPEGGYVTDLAAHYDISTDGLTYTVSIKPTATFSDGTPVTADDVIFTIQKTQDPSLKSPIRANWNGVDVNKIDDKTITISLKQSYGPFIENLTLGILPKHLWENVSDDEFPFSNLNAQPVGSGPFEVTSITRGSNGIPSSYTLNPFAQYARGEAYLSTLVIRFYQSESALGSALKNGDIEAASSLSHQGISELSGVHIDRSPVNRVYGAFFNQNQSVVLRDKIVRTALSSSIDRRGLVEKVLGGYGSAINGPLPTDVDTGTQDATSSIAAAHQMLLDNGWKPGADGVLQKTSGSGKSTATQKLSFSLSTGDVPELRAAAEYVRAAWSALGAQVTVKIFSQGDLSQNVIRARNYDVLLFGEVIGRSPDLYAFWGSSERNDPGLNIAMYANPAADKLLNQLRQTSDTAKQEGLYQSFYTLLAKDIPAVFLYTPDFVYSMPNDVRGVDLGVIETPSDRFLNVAEWHREVDHVWPFFISKQARLQVEQASAPVK